MTSTVNGSSLAPSVCATRRETAAARLSNLAMNEHPRNRGIASFDFDVIKKKKKKKSMKDKPAPITRNKSTCCEHKINTQGS